MAQAAKHLRKNKDLEALAEQERKEKEEEKAKKRSRSRDKKRKVGKRDKLTAEGREGDSRTGLMLG